MPFELAFLKNKNKVADQNEWMRGLVCCSRILQSTIRTTLNTRTKPRAGATATNAPTSERTAATSTIRRGLVAVSGRRVGAFDIFHRPGHRYMDSAAFKHKNN